MFLLVRVEIGLDLFPEVPVEEGEDEEDDVEDEVLHERLLLRKFTTQEVFGKIDKKPQMYWIKQ